MASAKSRGVEETERGLGVFDLSGFYQLQRPRQKHRLEIEKLIRFMFSLSGHEAGCHEEMDFFVREPRSRIHGKEMLHLFSGASRLFLELAYCTGPRVFARIESACRYFKQVALCCISVLPDHEDLGITSPGIVQKGDDRAGPGMSYHLELADGSVGKPNRIDVERDDLARIGAPRTYPARFFLPRTCQGNALYPL
jgi:hypothetical protein